MVQCERVTSNEYDEDRENFYPELVAKKGSFPSIEIDINHIPEKYQGDWTQVIIKATKKWIKNNSFSKKGTIWMWTTNSVNFHRNAPNFTEFIIPLGFPKNFLMFLNTNLKKNFVNRNVRLSDYVKFSDEWMTLCHVENSKVWKEVETYTYEEA